MNIENINNVLKSLGDEIEQKYKAKIIGIFGSHVRGDEKSSSDIDLLVDFNETADLFDFVGLSLMLEEKFHRRVDIIPRESLREEIKPYVMKELIYI